MTDLSLEEMRVLIEELLTHEARRGLSGRPNDCGCNSLSRGDDRLYETGQCVHQRARAAIQTTQAVADDGVKS